MSHEYRNQVDIANNEIITELLNGLPEFVEQFVTHEEALGHSTNTIKSYMYEINIYLHFLAASLKIDNVNHLEAKDLERITPNKIESYVSKSADGKKLTESAMRRKLSAIKSFYKYYQLVEEIRYNPTTVLQGAKLKEKDVITLSDAQVRALLSCIRNQEGVSEHTKAYGEKLVYRDLAIVTVLLGTGMRISELVGLNMNDFDLTDEEMPCFHIIRKGGDVDTVYFVDQVREAVMDYLNFSRPLLNPPQSENALFISTQHKRMGVNSMEKMVAKYCKAAGLPDNISPHKMRATFATTVYKQTKDIYAVKDSLHHKSIDTSKHYISDKTERKQSAASAAGVLFS